MRFFFVVMLFFFFWRRARERETKRVQVRAIFSIFVSCLCAPEGSISARHASESATESFSSRSFFGSSLNAPVIYPQKNSLVSLVV